jgi:hypothetical protein
MSYRALRSGEKGKSSKTYYTTLNQVKESHPKLFSKSPRSLVVQRDIACGSYVLIEGLYRQPLNNLDTKLHLAKIVTKLKTLFPDPEPWEICKLFNEKLFV